MNEREITMADVKNREVLEQTLIDESDEDTQKDKYLTFRLGTEDYAIEISYVTEIIGVQRITDVPDMPDFVKGVINLRGRVIPVIDVRTRFHMESRQYDDRTCVIVVNINRMDIGLVVDIVNEVLDIPEGQVSPPPKVSNSAGSRYVRGMGRIGESVKIILDVQRLLHDGELADLKPPALNQ